MSGDFYVCGVLHLCLDGARVSVTLCLRGPCV